MTEEKKTEKIDISKEQFNGFKGYCVSQGYDLFVDKNRFKNAKTKKVMKLVSIEASKAMIQTSNDTPVEVELTLTDKPVKKSGTRQVSKMMFIAQLLQKGLTDKEIIASALDSEDRSFSEIRIKRLIKYGRDCLAIFAEKE